MSYKSNLIVATLISLGSVIFASFLIVNTILVSYEIVLLKIILYDPKIINNGMQTNAIIKFFLFILF